MEQIQIKAPYNFVPLEEQAFYPKWANHISQDVPFKDGVSGSLEYTITAKTPIFVRNGQSKSAEDNFFSQTSDGRYFIPGTSIKGEIRNILEILSFGKMTQGQDSRFGIRDLSKSTDGDRYKDLIKNVFCGWLKKDGDYYILEDCGKPGRITPEEIDGHFHSDLKDFDLNLKLGTSSTGNSKEEDEKLRSAYKKYDLLKLITASGDNQSDWDKGHRLDGTFQFDAKDDFNMKFYTYSDQGEKGTLVLTGQPSARKIDRRGKWTGKYYEFIFFAPKNTTRVDGNVIEDFLTIHKNNYDFNHLWKDRLNFGEKIPVFFIKDDNGKVQAIGLAFMFRYPTANFIKGAIPASLQSSRRKDLAECMFGTESKALGALKGRVFFSPAFAEGQPQTLRPVATTLSSPKASFGPLYVKGGTWDDSNARIKGRKRYPVRNKVWDNEQGNDNTSCTFVPLKEGTIFKGTVRFHNLRMEEYGALLAALTFNGHNKCHHSIGEAKPLGYGKVKIDLINFNVANIVSGTAVQTEAALKSFTDMMVKFDPAWEKSASLKELFAMAEGIPSGRETDFQYLRMSTTQSDNEFKAVKDGGQNLPYFTSILRGQELSTTPFPSRTPKLASKLLAEITALDDTYLAIQNALDVIEDHLVKGELLEAGNLISKLDSAISERADLEKRLSESIQTKSELAENLYDDFTKSYRGLERDAALAKADQIINLYSDLMRLIPSEIKFVQRKQEVEKIITGPIGPIGLEEFFRDTALNSIAAFAGKLKKWLTSNSKSTLTEEESKKLGQIVKEKSVNLKSSDKKTWQDRRKWSPVENLIGKEMTDKAFDSAFKEKS